MTTNKTEVVRPIRDFAYSPEAVVRRMNELSMADRLVGEDLEILDVLVAGRTDPSRALRLIVTYLHKPSNTVGVQAMDAEEELFRNLETHGKAY